MKLTALLFLMSLIEATYAVTLIRRHGNSMDEFLAKASLEEFILLRGRVLGMVMLQCMASAANYLPRI